MKKGEEERRSYLIPHFNNSYSVDLLHWSDTGEKKM
jgi:hypothetical protein